MSKSLGTGIDPLDEIDAHGADAVRFGLLAMSSSQDVRYSAEKIQQGQQLANKMWNASRLVLLNAADVEPAPRPRDRRGPLDPVAPAARDRVRSRARIERYDFSHAAQELYSFFYSELCDWYLEMVKPRLYERGGRRVSATLLYVLSETLALAHPMHPVRDRGDPLVRAGRRGDLAVQPLSAGRCRPDRRGGRARGRER